jgi:hypothetical protein
MFKTHSFIYYNLYIYMISWDIDKSHNVKTSFVFFRIFKSFGHMIMVVFPGQDVQTSIDFMKKVLI